MSDTFLPPNGAKLVVVRHGQGDKHRPTEINIIAFRLNETNDHIDVVTLSGYTLSEGDGSGGYSAAVLFPDGHVEDNGRSYGPVSFFTSEVKARLAQNSEMLA